MSQADRTLLKELLGRAQRDDPITIYIARHGATELNGESGVSVDRERGWSDVPLTEEGRQEAEKAGGKLKSKGIEAIVSSDLVRACQTAKIIGDVLGIKPSFSSKLRPWNLGDLTGKPMTQARPQIATYARDPDERVKGGEPFNKFKRRAFDGIAEAISKHRGKTLLLVAHHRVERLIAAWERAGQPIEHALDLRTFLAKGDPPGAIITLKTHRQLVDGEIDDKLSHKEAQYEKGHDDEFCRTCKFSDHQSPPTCSFVVNIEKSGYCRLWTKDPNAKPAAKPKEDLDEKRRETMYG